MTDNNSLGYTTAEESELFAEVYNSSGKSLDSKADKPVNPEQSTDISTQIPPEVLAAMAEEKAQKAGEWLPKLSVRVNGVEVHGKKKNVALIVMLSFIVFFVSLLIFVFFVSA